jgi:hypothetical protein
MDARTLGEAGVSVVRFRGCFPGVEGRRSPGSHGLERMTRGIFSPKRGRLLKNSQQPVIGLGVPSIILANGYPIKNP